VHKFRRFGRLLAATTTTSLVLTGAAVAGAQEDTTVDFSVTNITDFHGYLVEDEDIAEDGSADSPLGAARLAALMDYVGQDNEAQIRTTSGDNVGGSAFVSAISDDVYTLEALNEMGIDVSAVGNHEFDSGFDDLQGRIQQDSDYPILGANVLGADGAPALPASHVIEEQGVKVGFIGTVTQQTPNKVSPAGVEGLTFTDPVAAANTEATRLKEAGEADVVIVLQHEDIQAFNAFNDDVDAAFGGDSHLRYNNGTDLAQSHEYGKALSELEFTYDTATGEITEQSITQYDYTSEGVAGLSVDPVVAETVAAAEAQAAVLGSEVVATIENDYLRGSNPGAEPGSNRGTESTANNMLAESNLRAMNAFLGSDVIDLGVMNAGGVRADLLAGDVAYKEAMTVQPFGNNLGYATVTGQALLDALENQWKGPEEGRPRLSLGVSDNVSYMYDPTAGQGERIINVMIDGEPLDPAGEYTVATASFLFEGGDGYFEPTEFTDVGYLDVTAFTDYLGNDDGPSYRAGQAEVGVTGLDDLTAGETATLELTSLSYSSEGEPDATTVTVDVFGQTVTAEVDNTVTEADAGYGEQGRATVEIEVPADAAGEHTLTIATDAGTEIAVPVTVGEEDSRQGSSGLPVTGSSALDSLRAVVASIGGVFASRL
jgi:5'-nucleotidase